MNSCETLSQRHAEALRLRGSGDPGFLAHAAGCEECRLARAGLEALYAQRDEAVPQSRPGAYRRAIASATAAPSSERQPRRGFASGFLAGAAAAAVVAVVVMSLFLVRGAGIAPQDVMLALGEVQDVSIAIDTDRSLVDAEIHVMLRGAIELAGYEGQRDIHWSTDLDAGTNELKLPVVAKSPGGGRLVVQVHHEGRRKTFQLAVTANAPGESL